jgi:hypothetical protein
LNPNVRAAAPSAVSCVAISGSGPRRSRQINAVAKWIASIVPIGMGHWLARTAQHWRTQQHQVNRFEPLVDHSYPFYGLLGRQRSLDSQSIDRPRAFDSNELAGNKRR